MKRNQTSGVYAIRNTINNKSYIGGTVSVKQRLRRHLWLLEKNIHYNQELQRDYNKYGASVFDFGIIEICSPEKLRVCEQRYLDSSGSLYNVDKFAKGPTVGNKRSSETRSKQSKTATIRKAQTSLIPHIESQKQVISDNVGNIFESLTSAAKFWEIKTATVCDILKGRHSKTRKGIIFRYGGNK